MRRDTAGSTIKKLTLVIVAYVFARMIGWDGAEVTHEPLVWVAIIAIGLAGLAALLSKGATP